jgi:hypothetical protein
VSDPAAALAEFVTYVETHLSGDEKGAAADFLDHLFRALGHAGVKEAGATRETRVALKARSETELLHRLPRVRACINFTQESNDALPQ